MDGDSPAGDGGPPSKRQRVTKACDQCRKRRVKCQTYDDAETGAPCRICSEMGQAAGCTFTRPSKKRGPQAGYAKNLAEKISAFERLLGHLILVHPPTLSVCETFFSAGCTTTPSEQTTAFNSSSLPNQLESHPLKGSPTSPADSLEKPIVAPPPPPPNQSTSTPTVTHTSSSAMSVEDRMSIKDPWSPPELGANGMSPGALSVAGSSSGATPTLLSMGQRPILGAPGSSMHPQPVPPPAGGSMPYFGGADHGALQTLASAAVPDHPEFYPSYGSSGVNGSAFASGGRAMEIEGVTGNGLGLSTGSNQMEGVVSDDSRSRTFTGASNPSSSAPTIPSLPPEAIRNQLLDLYFNQIVHPSYPMLDKSRFFRWSAHLPTQNAHTSVAASTLPPELFLAVYASVVPYLPSTSAKLTHSAAVFAAAGRDHLYHAMHEARLETVQACVLLALCDWGQGELNRAWALSCLSIALSINLSLHVSLPTALPDPDSIRLKTFHSTLILHTLLSLRLSRAPIIVLEDYDIPLPPIDGAENFELWRSDKSAAVLRSQHGLPESPGGNGRGGGGQSHAVRSCALSTFSKMSSLCAIGLSILRWGVCPRRGNGQGLAVGEQERQELVSSLQAWEQDLPTDLRLSEQMRGVEKVEERSRHTIELHLVLFMLYLRLAPYSSFAASSFDPVPQALALLAHLISQYRDLFTFLRSLPTVEGVLQGLSRSLFLSADYTPQQHDAPLKAYEELSMIFSVGKTSFDLLRGKVDDHRRELGLVRGIHPTPTSSTSLLPPSPSPAAASEPFQAFLNYSTDLGPSANPSTILDFGSWDQSDLLVSLGLVSGGGELAGGWGVPPLTTPGVAGAAPSNAPLPLPVEGEAGFAYGMPAGSNGAPPAMGGATSQITGVGTAGSPSNGEAAMVMNWPPPPPEQSFTSQAMLPQQQPTDLLSRWIGRGELGFGAGEGSAKGGSS